jgi:hypothetical protein
VGEKEAEEEVEAVGRANGWMTSPLAKVYAFSDPVLGAFPVVRAAKGSTREGADRDEGPAEEGDEEE